MTGLLRAMGRRSPALLLLLLLLVGGGGASGSTPHAVMTLDWTLAPAKKYLVDYLIKLNPFDACDEGKKDEIAKGFINFTRLYHSEDYPRDDAKGYTGMPLMLYASVLLFVIFVLVFIFWCLFRCCCRCCKCCNPVLYAPPEKRKRKECCCCFCYTFALLLFLATTALFIASALLAPKSVKSVDTDVLDPVEKYIQLIPGRLKKMDEEGKKGEVVEKVLGKIFTGFSTATLADSVSGYLDARLGLFLDAVSSVWGGIDGQDYEDAEEGASELSTAGERLENGGDTLNTYLSDLNITIGSGEGAREFKITDDISGRFDAISGVSAILGKIDKEELKKKITGKNEDGYTTTCGDELIDTKCLVYKVRACLLKPRGEMTECFANAIEEAFKEDKIKEELRGKLDDILDDIAFSEYAKEIEEQTDDILKYINYARLALNGKLDELLKEFDIDNDAISKYTNIASKVFPHMLLITCGVFALFMILYFIWPVSCALCLRKRNRAKGKCACKAWIKCTITLCGTPFVFALLILSILGLFSAVSYYIVMAEVFSTDESTFEEQDGTPAPIGKEFSKCAMNDYLNKRALIEKLLDSDDDETGGDSVPGGNKLVKGALKALAAKGSRSGARTESFDVDKIKDDAIDYIVDHIGSFLSCAKENDEEVEDKTLIACKEGVCDIEYINKYGNFLSALGFDKDLADFLELIVNVDLIKDVLCSTERCENAADPLLDMIDNFFIEVDDNGNPNGQGVYYDLGEILEELPNLEEQMPEDVTVSVTIDNSTYSVGLDVKLGPYRDYYKIFYDGTMGDLSDAGQISCLSTFVIGVSTLAYNSGESLSVSADFTSDLEKLKNTCLENGSVTQDSIKETLHLGHTFSDIMKHVKAQTCEGNPDSSAYIACDQLKGLAERFCADNKSTATGFMKDAYDSYNKLYNGLMNMIETYTESLDDFGQKYRVDPVPAEELHIPQPLTTSVLDTVEAMYTNLETYIAGFSGSELSGLLSCYPIGILKEKGVEMTNTYSHYFTMDHIAVLLMTVAVIVMMIAANCGPIVYHERYTRKCCCCCHTKRKAVKAPARTYAHAPAPAPVQGNVVQPAVIEIRVQGAAPGGPVIRTAAPGGATSDVEMYRSTYDSGHGRRYEGSADPYGQYGANEIYSSRPVYSDRESSYMGAPRRR